MHIVRATNPPSMTVTIDTVVYGNIVLAVPPAENELRRVDLVVAVMEPKPKGFFNTKQMAEVRYIKGYMKAVDSVVATPQNGWRVLARVYVHPNVTAIHQRNIEEVESYG